MGGWAFVPNSIKPLDANRSGLLFLNGVLYFTLFVIFELTPLPPSFAEVLDMIPMHLRSHVLAWAWAIAGLVQIFAGLCKKHRRVFENLGFAMAISLPMLWGVLYSISALYGTSYGFLMGFFSFSYGLILLYVAGWPNAIPLKRKSKGSSNHGNPP